MITKLVELLILTPFYPHWLDFRNQTKANNKLIPFFSGKVLETGCGNSEKKELILKHNKKVTRYIATDYSSWDENFKKHQKMSGSLGRISELLFGRTKKMSEIDQVCDALNLPFKNNSFNTYCSYEVLEHISEPEKFFREAYRVLKKNGRCILTMPFMYREHGGIDNDFQRLTRGGFRHLAKKCGFRVERIITNSYFGTTFASISNQFIIRKIMEGNIITKIIVFPISPLLFFIFNIIGYLIELFDRDARFAAHYHVVLKK